MMPRLIVTLSCFVLAVGAMSEASAAGRGGAPGASAGAAPSRGFAGPHLRAAPGFRAAPFRRMAGHGSHGRHHRLAGWGGYGDLWPWYDSGTQAGGVTVIVRQEAPPLVDPEVLGSLIGRTGIRPAPTPEPVIYRLEGSRERPQTRIIRISAETGRPVNAERVGRSRPGQNRIASAEAGALLLSVPAR